MSVGATPSLQFIATTVGDTAPHSMSELYRIRFTDSNGPASGTISLSDFRNKTISDPWLEQQKIQSSDIQARDNFGYSVAISGDGNTVIVGAVNEDTGGSDAGAAYIFTRSGTTWSQQQKIQASDKEEGDLFGSTVSISNDGNTIVAGTPYTDNGTNIDTGAAYIFRKSGTTWSQQAKLQATDAQADDYAGISVSISGDGNTVVMGAYGEDTGGSDAGAAYIFTWSGTTWSQQQKIQSSDIQAADSFGQSVAISSDGNTVVVGAPEEDTGALSAGAAYIFTRSGTTWSQQQKIQASDKEAGDSFGASVSISGDGNTVLVGAYGEDTGGLNAGAAYVFTRSGTTWSQQQKIQASDKEADDRFGYSVSISNDGKRSVVGAATEDTGGFDEGAAYFFYSSFFY